MKILTISDITRDEAVKQFGLEEDWISIYDQALLCRTDDTGPDGEFPTLLMVRRANGTHDTWLHRDEINGVTLEEAKAWLERECS